MTMVNIKEIVRLRKAKNISVAKLAEHLGVTARTVHNWESGSSTPGKTQLMAVAHILNVRLSDISDYRDLHFIYSKPSLFSENSMNSTIMQLCGISEEYRNIPHVGILPLQKAVDQNNWLNRENRKAASKISGLEFILNSIDSAVYIKDFKRNITWFNRPFFNSLPENLTEDIIGNSFSSLLPKRDIKEIIELENSVFKTGNSIFDAELISSFTARFKRISITPYSLDKENSVTEIICTLK